MVRVVGRWKSPSGASSRSASAPKFKANARRPRTRCRSETANPTASAASRVAMPAVQTGPLIEGADCERSEAEREQVGELGARLVGRCSSPQ